MPHAVWTTPIGDLATYVASGITPHGLTQLEWEFIIETPAETLRSAYTNAIGWGAGDRCTETTLISGLSLPIPDNFLVDDTYPDVPNNCAAILKADGETYFESQPLQRCTVGGNMTFYNGAGQYTYNVNTDSDAGIEGAHGGSGMSVLFGTIRASDCDGSEDSFPYALKCLVSPTFLSTSSSGYRWPASTADGHYLSVYTGAVSACRMGSLLALQPSFDVASLRTSWGRKIARTLIKYGMYIVDIREDTGPTVMTICLEKGPTKAIPGGGTGTGDDAVTNNYGAGALDADSTAGTGEVFGMDYYDIMSALYVVDNNSETNIGGGGVSISSGGATPLVGDVVYHTRRDLSFNVKIGNVNLFPNNALSEEGIPAISSIRVSKSFDSPVPHAEIEVSRITNWMARGLDMIIDLGYNNVMRRVFTGFVQSRSRRVAKGSVSGLGRSWSLFRTVTIDERDFDGKLVESAIEDLLEDVNVPDYNVSVDSYRMGQNGGDVKLQKMPASQMVQYLADIDGSRMWETNNGELIIRPAEFVPGSTSFDSYKTNDDSKAIILDGSDREDPDYFRNEVIVTGATPNTEEDEEAETLSSRAVLLDSSGLIQPPLPSGITIQMEYNNPLIDTQNELDSLALLLLTRYARIPRYLIVEIAGDPRIDLGMTIGLDFQEMGISNSRWFVHGVTHNVDSSGYRTQLQLRGGDLLGGESTLAPIASFSFISEQEVMGTKVLTIVGLDASASFDPDGSISSYAWSSNQPATMPGNTAQATVAVDTAGWIGDWEVTLTVTDSDGATDSITHVIPYGSESAIKIPAIYAALNNRASGSPDGGETWNDVSSSTCISVGARPNDGVNFGHACFGFSDGHIALTTDGCQTITTVLAAVGSPIVDIAWDWRNGLVVWALTENAKLYISIDAGVTWGLYVDFRLVTYVTGSATPSAIGSKIGLPAGNAVYVFGGTGDGYPWSAYDAFTTNQWVRQTFTGDLATDLATPADATMKIVDTAAPGNGIGCIILSWSSGGAGTLVGIYRSTDIGPTINYQRAVGLDAGLKTGRFMVADTILFVAAFADRNTWNSYDGITWTKNTNVFPANTVPWHAVYVGFALGLLPGVFAAALEDTVTPNNGYLVKTVDSFVSQVSLRPAAGLTTWPASARGKKIAIGGVSGPINLLGDIGIMDANTDENFLRYNSQSGVKTFEGPVNTFENGNMNYFRKYDANTLFCIDSYGAGSTEGGFLYRSSDGGQTWSKVWDQATNTGLPSGVSAYGASMYDIAPNGDIFLIKQCDTYGNVDGTGLTHPTQIYRSKNRGDSWELIGTLPVCTISTRVNMPIIVNTFCITSDGNHFVGSSWGTGAMPSLVNGTRNAGADTWSFTTSDPTPIFHFIGDYMSAAQGNRVIYAGAANDQIYTSDDFGATWTLRSDVAPVTSIHQLGWWRTEWGARNFYIANHGGATYYLYVTDDNGTTWREVPIVGNSNAGNMGGDYSAVLNKLFMLGSVDSDGIRVITDPFGNSPSYVDHAHGETISSTNDYHAAVWL